MSTRFQRYLLPGFAFKAVVIGGGYATGRIAGSQPDRELSLAPPQALSYGRCQQFGVSFDGRAG